MSNLSVTKPYQRRRRFSREFKAEIVAQWLEPCTSVSQISLDNGMAFGAMQNGKLFGE